MFVIGNEDDPDAANFSESDSVTSLGIMAINESNVYDNHQSSIQNSLVKVRPREKAKAMKYDFLRRPISTIFVFRRKFQQQMGAILLNISYEISYYSCFIVLAPKNRNSTQKEII